MDIMVEYCIDDSPKDDTPGDTETSEQDLQDFFDECELLEADPTNTATPVFHRSSLTVFDDFELRGKFI